MKRLNLGIGVMLILLLAGAAFAQTKTDQFFPDSTKGYVAVSNVNELRAHWRQTALGPTRLWISVSRSFPASKRRGSVGSG